jgi:hypothetical protein
LGNRGKSAGIDSRAEASYWRIDPPHVPDSPPQRRPGQCRRITGPDNIGLPWAALISLQSFNELLPDAHAIAAMAQRSGLIAIITGIGGCAVVLSQAGRKLRELVNIKSALNP